MRIIKTKRLTTSTTFINTTVNDNVFDEDYNYNTYSVSAHDMRTTTTTMLKMRTINTTKTTKVMTTMRI